MADQVAANIKAANRVISKATDMAADQLAADLQKAERTAAVPQQASPAGKPPTTST